MKKLLQKLMLNCEEATRLVSIKRYKKLSNKDRIKLYMHLLACKYCKYFSDFSDIVDESIQHVCTNSENNTQELSAEKKSKLNDLIKEEL